MQPKDRTAAEEEEANEISAAKGRIAAEKQEDQQDFSSQRSNNC